MRIYISGLGDTYVLLGVCYDGTSSLTRADEDVGDTYVLLGVCYDGTSSLTRADEDV